MNAIGEVEDRIKITEKKIKHCESVLSCVLQFPELIAPLERFSKITGKSLTENAEDQHLLALSSLERPELQSLLEKYVGVLGEIQKQTTLLSEMKLKMMNRIPDQTTISLAHIFILGQGAPRGMAIAVGRKTLLACAGSLASVGEKPYNFNSRRSYRENDWVQSVGFVDRYEKWNREENRIPVSLYKFHSVNNWALFVRTDGQEFPSFATIDRASAALPDHLLPRLSKPFDLFYCPVSVCRDQAKTYRIGCQVKINCVVQAQSTHQVCYEAGKLGKSSVGGALQWADSQLLFAMHCEVIPEQRDRENDNIFIHPSPKDVYYEGKQTSLEADKEATEGNPPLKKLKTAGETHLPVEPIYNLCGGHPGQGRAIVLSKFPRLLYHIDEIEENTP